MLPTASLVAFYRKCYGLALVLMVRSDACNGRMYSCSLQRFATYTTFCFYLRQGGRVLLAVCSSARLSFCNVRRI